MPAACPEALNQDATDPDHLEENIRKERRFQGVNHITTAAETPKAIIRVLAREERSPLLRGIMIEKHTNVREEGCQKARTVQEDIGNLNLKSKGQVWRMRTYPNHGYVKTYDKSEDPEDHLKIFQAVAKVERWAMPTWCHMFNSTLTGNARDWFDDLLSESIDSYDNLKEAFLANYLQQKKCIKDPNLVYTPILPVGTVRIPPMRKSLPETSEKPPENTNGSEVRTRESAGFLFSRSGVADTEEVTKGGLRRSVASNNNNLPFFRRIGLTELILNNVSAAAMYRQNINTCPTLRSHPALPAYTITPRQKVSQH
ncbi:reverse transcriptase domain-containing protein [Tanacetum coccineum]